MSWSIRLVGSPENIVKALELESTKLEDDSKKEFDNALPSMLNLLKLNYSTVYKPLLRFIANGHAYQNGEVKNSSLNISIGPLGETIV